MNVILDPRDETHVIDMIRLYQAGELSVEQFEYLRPRIRAVMFLVLIAQSASSDGIIEGNFPSIVRSMFGDVSHGFVNNLGTQLRRYDAKESLEIEGIHFVAFFLSEQVLWMAGGSPQDYTLEESRKVVEIIKWLQKENPERAVERARGITEID